jgi:formate hydrogenlyase transcriptional activator
MPGESDAEGAAQGEAEVSSFERQLAGLSASFINQRAEAIDAQIEQAVGCAAESLDIDRVIVGQRVGNTGHARITHQWVKEGSPRLEDDLGRYLPERGHPWTWARLLEFKIVTFSKLDDLPEDAARDKRMFRHNGVRSNAILPLVVAGELIGWLGFTTLRREREWTAPILQRLSLVAEIVAAALARKRAELELRQALDFERLLADLNASFVHPPLEALDKYIVQAIGWVAAFLGADRAIVLQHSPAEGITTCTHEWAREGIAPLTGATTEEDVPWLVQRVIATGEVIAVGRLDELPPEATLDRERLEQLGVRSVAIVPLLGRLQAPGLLAFSSLRSEQQWSSVLTERLILVGEVLASALSRQRADLALSAAFEENERLRERLEAEKLYLQEEVREVGEFRDVVGRSASLLATLRRVNQVAGTDATVLLLGETGTGKELLARAIHARSQRHRGPLIAINCAALPSTLIESELFGHEKGAFTGATHAKAGRFELADGGTLFLDEIGDLEPVLQTKLLRVLQEGEIERLGSTGTRKVNIRIVAATNRDLDQAIREGRFRTDLYYRLSVFPITVPPLRHRREDIPLLVWYLINLRQRALGRDIKEVPQAAMDALAAYDWPGNVRELQNVIERALILSRGPVLRIDEALAPVITPAHPERTAGESLRESEITHIVEVLERCHWVIEGPGQAAERLGLRPSTLRYRMKTLEIRRPAR